MWESILQLTRFPYRLRMLLGEARRECDRTRGRSNCDRTSGPNGMRQNTRHAAAMRQNAQRAERMRPNRFRPDWNRSGAGFAHNVGIVKECRKERFMLKLEKCVAMCESCARCGMGRERVRVRTSRAGDVGAGGSRGPPLILNMHKNHLLKYQNFHTLPLATS
jgi:hypothetical protein